MSARKPWDTQRDKYQFPIVCDSSLWGISGWLSEAPQWQRHRLGIVPNEKFKEVLSSIRLRGCIHSKSFLTIDLRNRLYRTDSLWLSWMRTTWFGKGVFSGEENYKTFAHFFLIYIFWLKNYVLNLFQVLRHMPFVSTFIALQTYISQAAYIEAKRPHSLCISLVRISFHSDSNSSWRKSFLENNPRKRLDPFMSSVNCYLSYISVWTHPLFFHTKNAFNKFLARVALEPLQCEY